MKPCGLRIGKFMGDRIVTDSIKVVAEQIEDDTGKVISKLVYEAFGSDRNVANQMSISLVKGMVGTVEGWAEAKAEATGGVSPKGVIR